MYGGRDAEINSFISPSSPPCDTLALQQCRGGPTPTAPPALRHYRHIASNTAQEAEIAPFLHWGEFNCVRLKPTPTSAVVGENWVKHLVEERANLLHNFSEEKASGKPPGQACRSSRRKQAAPLLLLQTLRRFTGTIHLQHFKCSTVNAVGAPYVPDQTQLPFRHSPPFLQQPNLCLLQLI